MFGAVLLVSLVAGPTRADDEGGAADARARRDTATLAARAGLLRGQSETARAQVRWRLRALYRLVVASPDLAAATRVRGATAGGVALARDRAEARALDAEALRAGGERDALEAAATAEPPIGARPRLAPPVAGAVLARFGTTSDTATRLLVTRAGVRLAARAGERARAPGAGTVARVEREADGFAVVLDHGAGWTTIVGGLSEVAVALEASVVAGQSLGVATRAGSVTFEVWRGRRPVDPLLPQLLAAPVALP